MWLTRVIEPAKAVLKQSKRNAFSKFMRPQGCTKFVLNFVYIEMPQLS